MITPTFSSTITLYHKWTRLCEETNRNVTSWVRFVLRDCYFGMQDVETLSDTTLNQASSYTARIPQNADYVEHYEGTGFAVSPEDIVVKGEVEDEVRDEQGRRPSDLLKKYKPFCFTVQTFTDNTKIPNGAHYKVTGA